MKCYDLHVHSEFSMGESTVEQIANMAKLLGYSGICFTAHWRNRRQMEIIDSEIERVKELVGIDILLGLEARSVRELGRLAKIRKHFDILLAKGGDIEMNRASVEMPEVDILTHPEYGRGDCGMNHVMMKIAAKNNVSIELNFREILFSIRYNRGKALKNMMQNMALARKYKAHVVLCSGALSHFELRDPYGMVSMAMQLGMSMKEAKDSVSKVPENIIKESVERTGSSWLMPGVKIAGKRI